MKKYIFVSDIHSNYESLLKLEKIKEFKDSFIVFGGDYIDGFNQSKKAGIKVLNYVKDMVDSGKAVAILGNHDDFLINTANNNRIYYDTWLVNGGPTTWESFGIKEMDMFSVSKFLNEELQGELTFLKSLPLYWKKDNLLAVHAGMDLTLPLYKQEKDTMLWIREDYIEFNGVSIDKDFMNKTIITGHTPTVFLGDEKCGIIFNNTLPINRYFIDGGSKGSPYNKDTHINVLILDETGEFQKAYQLT